jgi:hypothetical protein
MVLLISYDLNGHERPAAYQSVKKVIEDNALGVKKPLYSQWLVETNDSCSTWRERIRAVADNDDKILIVRVTHDYSGWLAKDIWPWLQSRI